MPPGNPVSAAEQLHIVAAPPREAADPDSRDERTWDGSLLLLPADQNPQQILLQLCFYLWKRK